MQLNRQHFEAALLAATTLHVAHKLWTAQAAGWHLDTAVLLALTALAIFQEHTCGPHPTGYRTKKAASEGTALGALALPWCFAALLSSAVSSSGNSAFASFAFRGSAASAAAILATIALHPTQVDSKLRKHPRSRKRDQKGAAVPARTAQSEGENRKNWHHRAMVAPVGLALVVLAAFVVISPVLQGVDAWGTPDGFQWGRSHVNGTTAAAGIALNATAGAGGVHLVLTHLPRSFTIGEAMVVSQAMMLLAADVALIALSLAGALTSARSSPPAAQDLPSSRGSLQTPLGERHHIHLFVELLLAAVLLTALCAIPLLRSVFRRREKEPGGESVGLKHSTAATEAEITADSSSHGVGGHSELPELQRSRSSDRDFSLRGSLFRRFRNLLPATRAVATHPQPCREGSLAARLPWLLGSREVVLLVLLLATAAAAAARPAAWALSFAFATQRRLAILTFWVGSLAAALPFMDWMARKSGLQTIVVRKGYHLLALALFAPALFLEPQLLAISLAIACALLVAVETVRVGQVPQMGPRIHSFMTSFIDDRDSGMLLVSHFSLLVGMAVPVWLCISGDSKHGTHDLAPAFAGIVVLGLADSAASALGRKFGRHKLLGTKKTVEGTLGGVVFNLLGWAVLSCFFESERTFGSFVYASVASCLLEAGTTQLDNIFLPLHHLTLLL